MGVSVTIELWLLFLPACFAINLSPGPNNLLVMQYATQSGFRNATLSAAGRIVSFALLIVAVSAGLSSILLIAPWFLTALKTVGGLYLLWIARSLWRAPNVRMQDTDNAVASLKVAFRREFWVALSNPKAILVFSAFLPQFVQPGEPPFAQLLWLGLAFLVLECIAIAFYALLGSRFRSVLATASRRMLFNRTCGVLLGLAGLTLLFTDLH